MAAAVPVMLRDFRVLIRKKVLWLFLALAVWLAVQGARGIIRGNSMSVLAADVKGFCYFVVVVPAVAVLNSKARVHKLMKTMLYASTALAVLALVMTCLYKWDYELVMELRDLDANEWIVDLSAIVKKKVPRLFFKSSNYMLTGCAFSIYFYVTERGRGRWHYPVVTGLCLFGMLVTYTRAVYLGAFVAAAVLVVVVMAFGTRDVRINLWKQLIAATLVFAVLAGGLSVVMGTNYIEHGIRRVVATFGTEEKSEAAAAQEAVRLAVPVKTAEMVRLSGASAAGETKKENSRAESMTAKSDKVREATLAELETYMKEAPVLGQGLGKAIESRYNGVTEYFYHELVMKTGVAGLVLYLLPALWMLAALLDKRLGKPERMLLGGWLAVLLGFMSFSYFNPYMNASLGILFYCCAVGVFTNLKHKRNSDTN